VNRAPLISLLEDPRKLAVPLLEIVNWMVMPFKLNFFTKVFCDACLNQQLFISIELKKNVYFNFSKEKLYYQRAVLCVP